MRKIIMLMTMALLFTVSAVSAAPAWQQTGDNANQTNYIDTASIRYNKTTAGLDRNIILFQSKAQYKKTVPSQYQAGGQLVTFSVIDVKRRIKLNYSYTYTDKNTMMSGTDTSGGTSLAVDKDPLLKGDYDFLTQYCKAHDEAIAKASQAEKAPAVSAPSVKEQPGRVKAIHPEIGSGEMV